eukprot:scaffold2602_cov177-Ochromonas_danica.AAC.3
MKLLDILLFCFLALAAGQFSFLFAKNLALSSTSRKNHFTPLLPIDAVDPFPANPTYVSLIEYSDASCLNVISAEITLLNVCMVNEEEEYAKYSCENGVVYRQIFSNTTCGTISSQDMLNGTNCVALDGSYYKVNCNAVSAYDFPKGNYVVSTIYDSDTCNAEVLQTNAVVNARCLQRDDGRSMMYNWPYSTIYYKSENCTGHGESYDLSVFGSFHNDDDDDNDVDYHVYHTFANMVVGICPFLRSHKVVINGLVADIPAPGHNQHILIP